MDFKLKIVLLFIRTKFYFPAMGIGRSKKEAKHAAAKNVLDKLIGNTGDSNVINTMSAMNEQLL